MWSLPLEKSQNGAQAGRRRWALAKASGRPPPNFCDHAAVATGLRVLLLGGSSATEGYMPLDALFAWDTQHAAWSRLQCGGAVPRARAGHVAAAALGAAGWRVYIFGGGNSSSGFDDLLVLDEACSWRRLMP